MLLFLSSGAKIRFDHASDQQTEAAAYVPPTVPSFGCFRPHEGLGAQYPAEVTEWISTTRVYEDEMQAPCLHLEMFTRKAKKESKPSSYFIRRMKQV